MASSCFQRNSLQKSRLIRDRLTQPVLSRTIFHQVAIIPRPFARPSHCLPRFEFQRPTSYPTWRSWSPSTRARPMHGSAGLYWPLFLSLTRLTCRLSPPTRRDSKTCYRHRVNWFICMGVVFIKQICAQDQGALQRLERELA